MGKDFEEFIYPLIYIVALSIMTLTITVNFVMWELPNSDLRLIIVTFIIAMIAKSKGGKL